MPKKPPSSDFTRALISGFRHLFVSVTFAETEVSNLDAASWTTAEKIRGSSCSRARVVAFPRQSSVTRVPSWPR